MTIKARQLVLYTPNTAQFAVISDIKYVTFDGTSVATVSGLLGSAAHHQAI